jgi:integrase
LSRSGKSGTVDLPPYVHRVRKARSGGRETIYTFYTRFRNTPEAWPSIQLPEPLSPEFLSDYEICKALERRDGKWSLHGVDLPGHKEEGFWEAARKAQKAKERRDHADVKDFTALVEGFEAHETFKGLASSTQRGYRASGKLVIAAWGSDFPSALTTVDAQEAIDGLGDTPASANQFRAYLSRLMAWGIPRGFCTINPVQFTEKLPDGEPWKPWPDWAFETFVEHAPLHILLPGISALFTGQRQGDVLQMQRPKKGDYQIEVTAQKTGNTVWIPVHGEYRRWIDLAPGASTKLHVGVKGKPYQTTDGFRAEWQRLMDTDPFKRFREERIVFHGLRKNAVINLLEVGCNETQVGAIVNMSEQMVRHYGKEVSIRALARDGMKLLESRWSEVRPAALEGEASGWTTPKRVGNKWEPSHRQK